jgi:glycosyltransferase involved in cell wall biosynthesis
MRAFARPCSGCARQRRPRRDPAVCPALNAVYVSHNSVGTALVRSQVLPYLRILAKQGVDTKLVTYERGPADFPEGEFARDRWIGIAARPGAHLVAKVLDVISGIWIVTRLVMRGNADVLHARSYLPAAVALVAALIARRPFIFDMRGFLGEEYVDTLYWRPTDLRYRVIRIAERVLLRAAAEIVVLTGSAAEKLRRDPEYTAHTRGKHVTIIPAAIDLERFYPRPTRSTVPTLMYAGSLGTWYQLDEMLQVYAHARQLEPRLRFLILNQREHALIADTVARLGLVEANIDVYAADFTEMPALLASAHVGILLLRRSASKMASSPIKVGEYLASGLPVVINAGMGDTDGLVRQYGAGYVVPDYSREALREAGRALVDLIMDERARSDARLLAEAEFDVRKAAAQYATVYRRLERRTRAA